MKSLILFMLILLSQTAIAQLTNDYIQKRFEESLIDSAIRYERIKPVLLKLKVAYEYRGREVDSLRLQITGLYMRQTVREQKFDREIADERKRTKKARWRGRLEGSAIGVLIGILL